jgi:hypothetical protein
MTAPRLEKKAAYDIRPDRRVRDSDVYDDEEARRPARLKFRPRRRGPAKIVWPMPPERALRLLTGRETLARALAAYASFVRSSRASIGLRPKTAKLIREEALEAPWTEEAFRSITEGYWRYPRKGFQVKKQKERISKLFHEIGLK